MTERDQFNRDDDQKAGSPPRAATEPKGAKASVQTPKTLTDPNSGEPNPGPQAPNQSSSERGKL